jgi:rhodanese-related sulfurtransferase
MIEDRNTLRMRSLIMVREISAVLEYGAPDPGETATMMGDKLRFHTDSWDLSVDLKAGVSEIIVIDARSRDAYAAGHIPGAISFPHREMSAETTAGLDRTKVYVVYCDGIGCNASTKGSHKLARLGFRTEELLGLDWWSRDGLRLSPAVYMRRRRNALSVAWHRAFQNPYLLGRTLDFYNPRPGVPRYRR